MKPGTKSPSKTKMLLNGLKALLLTAALAATTGCAGHNPPAPALVASNEVRAVDTGTPKCEIIADTPDGQAWVNDTIEQKVAGYGFPRPSPPGVNGCPEKPKVIYADPKLAEPAPVPKKRSLVDRILHRNKSK